MKSEVCLASPPQPNPSNKLAIVHILGLLSNLFTTLDVSHHEDEHEGSELRKLPVPQGPNPVGDVIFAAPSLPTHIPVPVGCHCHLPSLWMVLSLFAKPHAVTHLVL